MRDSGVLMGKIPLKYPQVSQVFSALNFTFLAPSHYSPLNFRLPHLCTFSFSPSL